MQIKTQEYFLKIFIHFGDGIPEKGCFGNMTIEYVKPSKNRPNYCLYNRLWPTKTTLTQARSVFGFKSC